MSNNEERLLKDITNATGFHGTVYPLRLADKQAAGNLVANGSIVEAAGSWGTTMCIGYRLKRC